MSVHGAAYGPSSVAAPPNARPVRELEQGPEGLRPPKRRFFEKWCGKRILGADSVPRAQALHESLRAASLAKPESTIQDPCAVVHGFALAHAASLIDLSARKLYAGIETELQGNGSLADRLSLACSRLTKKQVCEQLAQGFFLVEGRFTPQKRCDALAEEAYVALMSHLTRHDARRQEEAAQAHEHAAMQLRQGYLSSLVRSDGVTELEQLQVSVRADANLAAGDRDKLSRAVDEKLQRARVKPQQIRARIDAAAGLRASASADAQAHYATLVALKAAVDRSAVNSPGVTADLCRELDEAIEFTRVLSRRDEDLRTLESRHPNLATALASIEIGRAYVEHRQALDFVTTRVPAAYQGDAVLDRLDQMTGACGQGTLALAMRSGDLDAIDMVFHGSSWNEAAKGLKSATCNDEQRVEKQHQLREVTLALIDALQQDVRTGQAASGLFMRLFGSRSKSVAALDAPADLPANAKQLLDKLKSAECAKVRKENDLLILHWLHLERGREVVEENLDAILSAESMKALKELEVDPASQAQIAALFKNGDRSIAAVTARSKQVRVFSKSMRAAPIRAVEEARRPRLRAERIAAHLRDRIIGRHIENATLDQAHRALRLGLRRSAPHSVLTPVELGDLHSMKARRTELIAGLRKADETPGADPQTVNPHRAWLKDPAQRRQAAEAFAQIRALQDTFDAAHAASGSVDRALNGATAQEMAKGLRDLDINALRRKDAMPERQSPSVGVLTTRAMRNHVRKFEELLMLDEQIAAIESRHPAKEEAVIDQALHLAILEEALSQPHDLEDFDIGKSGMLIVKRMATYGVPISGSPAISASAMRISDKLAGPLAGKSVGDLCEQLDPESLRNVLSSWSPMPGAVSKAEQHKRDAVQALRSRFEQLKEGQSFRIRFGSEGVVTVDPPIAAAAGMSVSYEVRKSHGHTITVGQKPGGQWHVTIDEGGGVKHTASAGTLGQLLKISGYQHSERARGHDFLLESKDQCEQLALGLVTGEGVKPAAWSKARVETTRRESSNKGMAITAELDLSLAKISTEVAGKVGSAREARTRGFLKVETLEKRWELAASASAELAGDLGSKGVDTGRDRVVRRSVFSNQGTVTGSELTVAATCHGNADRTLASLVASELATACKPLLGQLGPLEEGSELSVRFELSDDALKDVVKYQLEAAEAFARGNRTRGDASMQKAHALLRDPASFVLVGVGAVARQSHEVRQNRAAYENVAATDDVTERLVPYEASDRPKAPAGISMP